jgi:RNA polymerase sigma-70 factor (ECF subfamily)
LENDAAVTTAVKEELNRFLADIERRALRIAEIATGSRDDALDIVQDAMVQLARHYAHRPAGEWQPLFHRILDNKILDWQRRQTVRRRLFGAATDTSGDDEDPLHLIPDLSQPDGAQQLKRTQAMAVLERALRNLPKRQRQAFVLRIWEGLSVEETAAVMGCGDGSVKTHLSRALHTLREQLQTVWP